MKQPKKRSNSKRRFASEVSIERRRALEVRIEYGGNPEHKKNPGDFDLTPPSQPRPDKSLCDNAAVFLKAEALSLLRAGVRRGLVSEQVVGDGLPQNIWSVTAGGVPLEAQLENRVAASYHGYPLLESDPFHQAVLKAWTDSEDLGELADGETNDVF